MDFQGGQDKKNGKFQGDHVKFDWKFRGVNFKKIDVLNRGSTILFWKVHYTLFDAVLTNSY